jgi:hypothetical protein
MWVFVCSRPGLSVQCWAGALYRPSLSSQHVICYRSMSSHNIGHVVTRTGFPFSHGRIITSTACQGRTMHEGVVIDCGRLTEGATPKLTWGSAAGVPMALIDLSDLPPVASGLFPPRVP